MEHAPKSHFEPVFDDLSYDQKSIRLYEMADSLLIKRQVPNEFTHHSGERYHVLQLDDEELVDIEPIFDAQLIDAPTALRIRLTNQELSSKAEFEGQDVLIIATESGELHLDYFMWYTRSSTAPVDFTKDAVRIYDSPRPYTVGPLQGEAVMHDPLYRKAQLEQHDMRMLHDLLMHLTERSV